MSVDLEGRVFAVVIGVGMVIVNMRPRSLGTDRDECEEHPACDKLAHVWPSLARHPVEVKSGNVSAAWSRSITVKTPRKSSRQARLMIA